MIDKRVQGIAQALDGIEDARPFLWGASAPSGNRSAIAVLTTMRQDVREALGACATTIVEFGRGAMSTIQTSQD